MARPLTDISEERIKEYEKQLEAALEKKNYQRAKEIKRLFRVYIERRGYTISDYKEHSIYNKYHYEHRQPRREISKVIIKDLENELREYKAMPYIKIDERKTIHSQLSKEKQEELWELAYFIVSYDEILLPPEIIDMDLHNDYLQKIENGADPDDLIDKGVYRYIDVLALSALIELLTKIKWVEISLDKTSWIKKHRTRQYRELETERHLLDYSINKKYKMREYRKKLYVIKRINEMLNDGKDYTDFVKEHFDSIGNLIFNDEILNKVFKAIKIYKKEYQNRLKQNIKKRTMAITKKIEEENRKKQYIIERLTEEMDDDYNYADAVNNYYKNPNSLIKELREAIEMAIEIFGKEYEEKKGSSE